MARGALLGITPAITTMRKSKILPVIDMHMTNRKRIDRHRPGKVGQYPPHADIVARSEICCMASRVLRNVTCSGDARATPQSRNHRDATRSICLRKSVANHRRQTAHRISMSRVTNQNCQDDCCGRHNKNAEHHLASNVRSPGGRNAVEGQIVPRFVCNLRGSVQRNHVAVIHTGTGSATVGNKMAFSLFRIGRIRGSLFYATRAHHDHKSSEGGPKQG